MEIEWWIIRINSLVWIRNIVLSLQKNRKKKKENDLFCSLREEKGWIELNKRLFGRSLNNQIVLCCDWMDGVIQCTVELQQRKFLLCDWPSYFEFKQTKSLNQYTAAIHTHSE